MAERCKLEEINTIIVIIAYCICTLYLKDYAKPPGGV